jgi:outer membrane lipoprotein-sorting protein
MIAGNRAAKPIGKNIPMKLAVMKLVTAALIATVIMAASAKAQTDCSAGNGDLDSSPPKEMTPEQIIQKFGAEETKVKEARSHYSYTQDVLVQTLNDKTVDGQFHQVATVSYDDKGKRGEVVTFAEQSTLRGLQLSEEDMDDIRVFMPLILTTEDIAQYTVTYSGQQHVDDLDTYVFHVVPKKEEKNKRYFEGKVWVDNRDFQIVKVCGKSVPDAPKKKKGPQELRPTFVSYRQLVDGYWFPAYTRVDDTLHFRAQSVQLHEVVKETGYKRTGAAAKP